MFECGRVRRMSTRAARDASDSQARASQDESNLPLLSLYVHYSCRNSSDTLETILCANIVNVLECALLSAFIGQREGWTNAHTHNTFTLQFYF